MSRIVITATVDRDGIVHLDIPVGRHLADRQVRLTVEHADLPLVAREEWSAWVESKAGVWRGDFERPPQPTVEDRAPL